jgi:hypothetical protein
MPKQIALFTTVLLSLAGANLVQVWSFLSAFFFGQSLPDTTFFFVVFWFWVLTALGTAWCGLSGGYAMLRGGTLRDDRLTAFVLASCVVFKVGTIEFGYSMVRLAFTLGILQFHLGVNILGLLLSCWFFTLRRQAPAPAFEAEAQIARGRGAV